MFPVIRRSCKTGMPYPKYLIGTFKYRFITFNPAFLDLTNLRPGPSDANKIVYMYPATTDHTNKQ